MQRMMQREERKRKQQNMTMRKNVSKKEKQPNKKPCEMTNVLTKGKINYQALQDGDKK